MMAGTGRWAIVSTGPRNTSNTQSSDRISKLLWAADQGIQSHRFVANRRGKSGSSDRFYFLGLQITDNSDCSHEIKRHLLLRRKAMTNLDSVLKSRDITLPTKIHIVKDTIFPVAVPCTVVRVGP